MNVWRIRNDLFIRGMFDKRPGKLEELRELGVGTVICMLRKTDPDLENLDWLRYRNFPLGDARVMTLASRLAIHQAAVSAFFDIIEGRKVLIHCIAARDRAPSTAALTLHYLEGISGIEAIARVKSIKRTTFHNAGLIEYLSTFSSESYLAFRANMEATRVDY